jgi:uncharacterized protein YdaU (DUF1376 family)
MHYYKRNLGDYAKKAGRLSMLQHGSYTLLMDSCYDREQFPTLDEAIEWTWASTTDEIEAVKFVLSKFFVLENGIYVQKRIQEELAEYREKAETNKRIALERETKRKEKATNREHIVDEPPPNHKPITKNHKPITNTKAKKQGDDGKKKKPPSTPIVLPDFIPADAWQDWHNYRNSSKGWTTRAKQLSLSTLVKLVKQGHDPQTVINASIERGWTGLFATKATGTNGTRQPILGAADRVMENHRLNQLRGIEHGRND